MQTRQTLIKVQISEESFVENDLAIEGMVP
jgi:hypothetical protein